MAWRYLEEFYGLAPLPASALVQGAVLDPALGVGQPTYLCHFRDRFGTFWYDAGQVVSVAHRLLERLEDPSFWPETAREIRERIRRLDEAGERAVRFSESSSNAELARKVRDLWETHDSMMRLRVIPNLLDYAHPEHKNLLQDRLEDLLKGIESDEQAAAHAFTALTSWPESTGSADQVLDAARKALEICKDPRAVRVLTSSQGAEQKLAALAKEAPVAARILEEHRKRFEWLSYMFTGPCSWDTAFFVSLFAELVMKGPETLAAEAEARQRHPEHLKREALEYKRELALSERDFQRFQTLAELVYLKTFGKEAASRALYLAEPLFREVGRRAGLTLVQVQSFAYDELLSFLEKGTPLDARVADERNQGCVMVCAPGGYRLYTGEEARRMLPEKEEAVAVKVDELHGTTASAGQATGRARIVNVVADMAKMAQGDILVSDMTQPDLVPAMKKAGAIITNKGGLTCHAAIVSREFGIPCVVGTKIATQALRDGDLLEVDASKGIVRVLSRAA
jgi:phosphohistidine swiveling domain-containing protein